ncbi:MAG: LLM class F420-dependent oxidoreductase [Acidimicrobiia bacterium]
MRIGLMMFPTDGAIQPVDLGRAAEEHGFESLWFPEHSHIPVSRRTPWGGMKDAPPLPEYYWRTHDQFVAFAAIAATTTSLRLCTGITLVAQRDPLWLAKQVASLDVISGGRVVFGVGYGWNKEEMAHHGVRYTERRAMLREKVLAMKALWTEDETSFEGDHVAFQASWSWPKPAQKPHPPVVLGGAPGPRTLGDVVEFCDGWMPIYGRHDVVEAIARLHRVAEDAGRDPTSIEIGVFSAPPDVAKLEGLAHAGVQRAVIALPPLPADEVLPRIERHAGLIERFAD